MRSVLKSKANPSPAPYSPGSIRPSATGGSDRKGASIRGGPPGVPGAASDRSGRSRLRLDELREGDCPAKVQGLIRAEPPRLSRVEGPPCVLAEPRQQRPGLRGGPLFAADHGEVRQRRQGLRVLRARLAGQGLHQLLGDRPGTGEVAQRVEQGDATMQESQSLGNHPAPARAGPAPACGR